MKQEVARKSTKPSEEATFAPTPAADRAYWRSKLEALRTEFAAHPGGLEALEFDFDQLTTILEDPTRTPESTRDALSTRMMELFRLTQARTCFGLLYELNGAHLLIQVGHRLRRYQSRADPHDLLQEVFFNVYRYPRNFDCRREDAFRVWSATIVRNTVLKFLRSLARSGRAEVPFEDLSEHPESGSHGPLVGAIERESVHACRRVYLTYLSFYLHFYGQLSAREQRALELVEVERQSYRSAAAELGIKLENLKMVVFRARRKIQRSMRRVFDGLPPDMRSARQPAAQTAAASSSIARRN